MLLELKDLACGYQSKVVVKDISLTVRSGEILSLLGPNGVGKTTIFKTILGFLKKKSGDIRLDDENIDHWSRRKLAKIIAYVPQEHTPPFPYSVIDVVVMGRTASLDFFASPSKKDYQMAEDALDSLHIGHLKNRIYTEISGGERQMVLIARALTQQPQLLIMDEPTSNLDFGNQVKVLDQIYRLAQEGLGIFMTTHFPDHAFLCSSKVALLQRKNKLCVGDVENVVTEKNLYDAYGVKVQIIQTRMQNGEYLKSCVPILQHMQRKAPACVGGNRLEMGVNNL